MTNRQAVRAAKKRGLIDKEVAQSAAPVRHRRTCPACGGTFLPDNPHRLFCPCGCCANTWGKIKDAEDMNPPEDDTLRFRWMHVGDPVVLLVDGRVGKLRKVRVGGGDGEAIIEIRSGEMLTVGPKEVERVQFLEIKHVCGKGRNPFATAKKGADNGDGEGEVAGVVPGGAPAGRADREPQHAGSTGDGEGDRRR